MLTLATASTHPVTHVAFSPDGSIYAVVQPNYGVTLMERGTNRPVGTIAMPRGADYTSAIFCDGGERLALGSGRGVHVFDVAARSLVRHYGGYHHGQALVAERNGELLAATSSGVRKLHEPRGVGLYWSISTPLGLDFLLTRVHALSPDGRWLVARITAAGSPSLIDLDAGAAVAALHHPAPEHDRIRLTACFAPNGGRFAVSDGQDVSVYDAGEVEPGAAPEEANNPRTPLVQRAKQREAAPKPRVVLQPAFRLRRPGDVQPKDLWQPPIAFTPDGRGLLVRRPRNRVQLWDVATGTQLGEWSWRTEDVKCLAVAPDGLTAVAGARFGRVVVWDLD
jgi:WD40 repeat protein